MSYMLIHLRKDLIEKHQSTSGKIFLSYSRKNHDFAKALYVKLSRMGFDLWSDVGSDPNKGGIICKCR